MDKIRATPIAYALCTGHEDIIDNLKDRAVIHSVDERRRGLLLSATWQGFEPIVKRLLDSRAEVDTKDPFGRTPLWHAVVNRNEAIVKLLIEKGAGANAKTEDGWTPLSLAELNGYKAIVQLLVENGASVNVDFPHHFGTRLLSSCCNERLDSYETK